MTKQEITIARKLLEQWGVARTESINMDTGGFAITAYWLCGGQRLFYSLDDVREHVNEIAERR